MTSSAGLYVVCSARGGLSTPKSILRVLEDRIVGFTVSVEAENCLQQHLEHLERAGRGDPGPAPQAALPAGGAGGSMEAAQPQRALPVWLSTGTRS